MVVPISHNNLHEINFLKNHPLGPRLTIGEIADYLKLPEIEIDVLLKHCVLNDYGGCDQELDWLQTHPLGPKYIDNCSSSVKIACSIVWNFLIIIAYRICDQLPLIQQIFHTLSIFYTRIVDIVSEYVSDGSVEDKHDDSMAFSGSAIYNLSSDSPFSDAQLANLTSEAWITADLSGFEDSGYVNQITVWRAEFLDIFPMPEIVHELYDGTMTSEKHQMNMILATLEEHLANGYQNETAASVLMIRAKHYREWFCKLFPVAFDEYLLNLIYTPELTFERHIDMMKLALRTKYSQ